MSATLEPDRASIEVFVNTLLRHAGDDGYVSMRSFHEDDSSKPFRISPVRLNGKLLPLIDVAVDDARRAANDPKRVVFCPPIAVFASKYRAAEADLAAGLVLNIELDQNPKEALVTTEFVLGPATVVVRSGGVTADGEPKLHAHWLLARPARGEDLAKLKRARRLATKLAGGDPSNISTVHPIRWPGSYHRKAEPRLCEIERVDPDIEIDLDEALEALIAAVPEEKAEPRGNGTNHDNGQHDRADWAGLVANIIAGRDLHDSTMRLAAAYIASGMDQHAAQRAIEALYLTSNAPHDERWKARFDDIGRAARTAWAKFHRQNARATAGPAQIFEPWEQYVVPPFPFDVLPDDVRRFVETQSKVIGCDPSAMAMAVLAAFSGAIDHRIAVKMLRNGDWYASPRLWVLLVGNPSAKKTPCFNAATRELERHESKLWKAWEARKAEILKENPKADEPPKPPRFVTHDGTIEALGEILVRHDRGILVKRDEIAGWVGSLDRYHSGNKGSSADRAFYLQAYDGGPYTVDRIKRGEQRIDNLSVSILGGIQPDRLKELHGLTSDGLLQRFLPVTMSAACFPVDEATTEAAEAYRKLLLTLINAGPATVIMTDQALAAMEDARRRLHDLEQVSDGVAQGFQAFVGKLHGILGTVALILHMIQDPLYGNTSQVEATTVANAARLVEGFVLPHAFEFYRTAESATDGDRLQKVASYILTSGKDRIVVSDLTKNVAPLRGLTMWDVNQRVSPLIAGGWLAPEEQGPVSKSWTVNPEVFGQLKDRIKTEERRKAELATLMNSPRRGG